MKPIESKYNFEQSLNVMDSILRSGEVIPRPGSFTSEQVSGARGAFMKATVLVATFGAEGTDGASDSNMARAYDVLLTQVYDLMAGQPLLLYLDWDGERLRAVFNTTKKPHIDAMVDMAGKIISLTDVINYKVHKETGIKFNVSTAVDYGEVFSVPIGEAGVLMTGKVLRETEGMLSRAAGKRVVISRFILQNLKDDYQKLFEAIGIFKMEYHADIVNIGMHNWLKKQG